MSIDEIREAFESRRTPNLDLKRNEDGGYSYQAAQLAFRDFADGWQAAKCSGQPDECLTDFESYWGERGCDLRRLNNPSGYVEFNNKDVNYIWMGWKAAWEATCPN